MTGPRAAACAGEICTGHGGIKSRETSVARNWHVFGPCQFRRLITLSGVGDERLNCPETGNAGYRATADESCVRGRLGFELMPAFAEAIERRFGDGGPSGEGAADNEFIRRVLARKTVRRYSDVIPSDGLLDL